jgi:hypothetical protein
MLLLAKERRFLEVASMTLESQCSAFTLMQFEAGQSKLTTMCNPQGAGREKYRECGRRGRPHAWRSLSQDTTFPLKVKESEREPEIEIERAMSNHHHPPGS